MNICEICGGKIPSCIRFNGLIKNTNKRKKCINCLPFEPNRSKRKSINELSQTDSAKRQRDKYREMKENGLDPIKIRRDERKFTAIKITNGCQFCGYNRCIQAIAFHHVDPKEKRIEMGMQGLIHPIVEFLDEFKKCVISCHNCHSEIHQVIIAEEIVNIKHEEIKVKIDIKIKSMHRISWMSFIHS